MLHIVNKSPYERNALEACLRLAQPGSALLLIEDGVYAATRGSAAEASLKQAMARVKVYALKPDLEARGVAGRVMDGIQLVDFGGFVDLACEQPNCQSWL
ncbi:MAG: sulfurtransferase complex subunit TusB [Sphingomonadaceae bacterium]